MPKAKKVKDLLTSRAKWRKGVFAATKDGHSRFGWESDVVRWCLKGALDCVYKEAWKRRRSAERKLLRTLKKHADLFHYKEDEPISIWNDDRKTKWEDVQKLLEMADV